MANTLLIAIGVVVPLTALIGGATAFICFTERKRRSNIAVCEIPHRPRVTSRLYRLNKLQFSHQIEDGIEVCSPRPSVHLPRPISEEAASTTIADYKPPNLQTTFTTTTLTRQDSALQSPTDTVSELEGTLPSSKYPFKPPSRAKFRHSSDVIHKTTATFHRSPKEIPTRASLQQPIPATSSSSSTTTTRTTMPPLILYPGTACREILDAERMPSHGGTNSPTVSAISELSGRGVGSPRHSDVPGDLPIWIKRMSVQEEMTLGEAEEKRKWNDNFNGNGKIQGEENSAMRVSGGGGAIVQVNGE